MQTSATEIKPSYCIFMDGGDGLYVIGKTGGYETELSKAMTFKDKLDAIIYVEKRGYQKIARIREIKK